MGVGVSNGHRGARLQRPPKRVPTPGALDKGPFPFLTTAPPGTPHFPHRRSPFLALQSQLRSSCNNLCPWGSDAQRTQGVPGLFTLSPCTRRRRRGGV